MNWELTREEEIIIRDALRKAILETPSPALPRRALTDVHARFCAALPEPPIVPDSELVHPELRDHVPSWYVRKIL